MTPLIISLIFCRHNGKNELYYIKISNFLKNRAIFTFITVKKDIQLFLRIEGDVRYIFTYKITCAM
jgi:hypothetical protein